MTTKIELVAFDLGNVLCTVDEVTPGRKLAEISGRSPAEVHDIVFGPRHKLLFETGKISFGAHARQAIANLELTMSVGEFTDIYNSVLIPTNAMFPLVSKIAESHRIALVSNTSEPHWECARRFLPFSARLDPVIVSCAVGSMKPDPAFYESLLDQSEVPASQIFFIDDLALNVEAARNTGMSGHVFTSQPSLEHALSDLGVIQPR